MSVPPSSDLRIESAEMPEVMFKIMNPIMRFLVDSPLHGLVDSQIMLLRWRGHKSGKEYTIPVGYKRDGNVLTVFTFSNWQANFRTPHPVEVKLKGEWRSGTAVVQDDPRKAAAFIKDAVASGGRGGYQRFRMEVKGDREPTIEELVPEVEKRDMVLVKITLAT